MVLTLFLLGLVYAVLVAVLFAAGAGAVLIAVVAGGLFLIQFFTSDKLALLSMGAREVGPGEIRGACVEGGTRRELRAGDVAHIAAATPHQMLLSGSDTFAALVLKIEQPAEEIS